MTSKRSCAGQIAADNVRVLREAKGWTQLDLAVRLGVHTSSVRNIEKGFPGVRVNTLEGVAEVFGITLSELIADRLNLAPIGADEEE